MYISDLALSDFRSYDELVLALEPGPTALIGPNGQGKTNLVEAVAYLSTLSSHRAGADTAMSPSSLRRLTALEGVDMITPSSRHVSGPTRPHPTVPAVRAQRPRSAMASSSVSSWR